MLIMNYLTDFGRSPSPTDDQKLIRFWSSVGEGTQF